MFSECHVCEHSFTQQYPQSERSCGIHRQNSSFHKEGWEVTRVQRVVADVRHEDISIPVRATPAGQLVIILNTFFYSGKDYQDQVSLSPTVELCYKERKDNNNILHKLNWNSYINRYIHLSDFLQTKHVE